MFLSEKTSEALDELVGACFDMNRTIDRMCSVMQNVFTAAPTVFRKKNRTSYC